MISILVYFLTIGWYGYVLRMIANAELPLIVTIIMLVGGLAFGFFSCLSLHKFFSEDDKEG
jgi:hypothetical protein